MAPRGNHLRSVSIIKGPSGDRPHIWSHTISAYGCGLFPERGVRYIYLHTRRRPLGAGTTERSSVVLPVSPVNRDSTSGRQECRIARHGPPAVAAVPLHQRRTSPRTNPRSSRAALAASMVFHPRGCRLPSSRYPDHVVVGDGLIRQRRMRWSHTRWAVMTSSPGRDTPRLPDA
jgi:hypothetical protein